ncbi:hypothetical protein WI560_19205 [Bradyrhizobium sp. A11]|uniref:hypothetical protein n=1 Tax=Bradyrhizobium sp. A11 TaxID=3133974 RepID=UPI003251122F
MEKTYRLSRPERSDVARARIAFEANKQKMPATEARWLANWGRSRIGLSLTAVAALVASLAAFSESTDKIAIWVGLKPDSLQIAQDGERAKFSRDLARSMWFRLFLSRKVLLAAEGELTSLERNKLFEQYDQMLSDWNRDLMVNIMSLAQYYDKEKARQFERQVQPSFVWLNKCLDDIKRSKTLRDECEFTADPGTRKVAAFIDDLNAKLYCFMTGLPQSGRECFRRGAGIFRPQLNERDADGEGVP